jgi:hypothetical protein
MHVWAFADIGDRGAISPIATFVSTSSANFSVVRVDVSASRNRAFVQAVSTTQNGRQISWGEAR